MQRSSDDSGFPVDFAIITVLDIELQALLNCIDAPVPINPPGDPYTYHLGRIELPAGHAYTVLITQLSHMGDVEAAAATTHIIERWKPGALILVGLGGGIGANGVRVGDVVIAESVFYYEPAKVWPRRRENRPQMFQCDVVLYSKARTLGESPAWLAGAPPLAMPLDTPHARTGPIGAGEKVIQRPRVLNTLLQACPILQAVANEGAGVARAASISRTPFLEIRGISDLADGRGDNRWRAQAANVAAVLTRNLLHSHPTLALSETRQTNLDGRNYSANVMIGSGILDLPEHKKAVEGAIERCGMRPIVIGRNQSATVAAVEESRHLLESADAYIGIFANHYGQILPGQVASLLDIEYHLATQRLTPIVACRPHEDHPFTMRDIDFDAESRSRMERLKQEVQNHETGVRYKLETFRDASDLGNRVFLALSEMKGAGVLPQRSTNAESLASSLSAVPERPQPYYVHQYVGNGPFYGRATDLETLNRWELSGDVMMVVDALGGVGKSALTWRWVHEYYHHRQADFEGLIWWSFDEKEGMPSNFLRHALAYVTRRSLKEVEQLSRSEQEQVLLAELGKRRYLLALDGAERMLRAYRRVDAAQVSDRIADEGNSLENERLSRCIDPRDGKLLRKLAQCTPSKVLMSTRILPEELRDEVTGKVAHGVQHLQLGGLDRDDALAMMRAFGIRGSTELLIHMMEQLGYHTLTLQLLAGRVNNYRPAPGDFDEWYREVGADWKLSELEVDERYTHILKYALEGLDPKLRFFLCQIAVFDHAVDYAAISVLNPFVPPLPEPEYPPQPDDIDVSPYAQRMRYGERQVLSSYKHDVESALARQGISSDDSRRLERELAELDERLAQAERDIRLQLRWEEECRQKRAEAKEWHDRQKERAIAPFNQGLTELEDRGLLQWDHANRYELHPVVRSFAFEQLNKDDRKRAFSKVRTDYFDVQTEEDPDHVTNVSQLQRTLDIYRAYLGEEKWDEAINIFGRRLDTALNRLGEFRKTIELLEPLFPSGLETRPQLSDAQMQWYAMNEVASNFRLIGEIPHALDILKGALALALHMNDVGRMRRTLGTLVLANQEIGAFSAAEQALNLALMAEQKIGDLRDLGYCYLQALHFYADTGRWDHADAAYEAFLKVYESPEYARDRDIWGPTGKYLHAQTLIARGLDGRAELEEAEQMDDFRLSSLVRRFTNWLHGVALLMAQEPVEAEKRFEESLQIAINTQLPPASYRIGIAKARLAQGLREDALQMLEKAMSEDVLPEYRAERLVSAAEIHLALGNHAQARSYALEAYRVAWAEGPPYCWAWELKRAQQALGTLGVDEPRLEPFDPNRVISLQKQDEILRMIDAYSRFESWTDPTVPVQFDRSIAE